MKKDPESLSPEARAIIRAQMTRRSLLVGAGAIAGATTLAACGTGSSETSAEGVVDVSDTEKIVRWANWPLYLDFDEDSKEYPTLKAFENATGITATYTEDIDDNNTFYGKVQGQLGIGSDIGYDIVTPTDWMAARWIRLGYAREFDEANMPNKGNILDTLANVSFDPGRKHSMTWQSGFAGFCWNKNIIKSDLTTIEQLFSPENKGRVVVLSEMRDTMGIILQYQGVDISQPFTEDEFMNAIDYFKKMIADGFIRQVKGNDYLEDMANGDAVAAIGWSGDMFSENLSGQNYGFAIPESGGTLWSDNVLIASTSANKSNSEKLIDHYYDPIIAAEVAAWVNYICPVKGAQAEMEKIDPELANSPFIFPDDATLSKVSVFRGLSAEEEFNFSAAFQEAIGA